MINLRVGLQITAPAEALREEFDQATPDELRYIGAFWHSVYLPLHFRATAFSRYGAAYERRDQKYERRKKSRDPMVYTGTMRQQVLSSARVTASRKQMRVTVSGVRALNLAGKWRKHKLFPDFRREITAFTSDEATNFAQRLSDQLTDRMNALKRPAQGV